MGKPDRLKRSVWSAAGWGNILCSRCGSERYRIPGLGGSTIACSNEKCREKQQAELEAQQRYWEEPAPPSGQKGESE